MFRFSGCGENWRTGELVNWITGELVNWTTGELVNRLSGCAAQAVSRRINVTRRLTRRNHKFRLRLVGFENGHPCQVGRVFGVGRVIHARAQVENAGHFSAAQMQGEDVFALHRFDDAGSGDFGAVFVQQNHLNVGAFLEGCHFDIDAGAQRVVVQHRLAAQFQKAHRCGEQRHNTVFGVIEFGKEKIHVISHGREL
ncbi:MAG: hypothetical protein CO094_06135 [Anaerolineae bacterium CG_4_9_14_3_um_filter_57_17]|nr:MAG: hypothetical protein CO094_06135 [Anaerolineae bacterium CG_4_9_14_3_um_filter_57_17]